MQSSNESNFKEGDGNSANKEHYTNYEEKAPLIESESQDATRFASLSIDIDDEAQKKDKDGGKDDIYQRNIKLAFCFFGLQVSYVLWGVAQEQIMTHVYKSGKFTSSAVYSMRYNSYRITFMH